MAINMISADSLKDVVIFLLVFWAGIGALFLPRLAEIVISHLRD